MHLGHLPQEALNIALDASRSRLQLWVVFDEMRRALPSDQAVAVSSSDPCEWLFWLSIRAPILA